MKLKEFIDSNEYQRNNLNNLPINEKSFIDHLKEWKYIKWNIVKSDKKIFTNYKYRMNSIYIEFINDHVLMIINLYGEKINDISYTSFDFGQKLYYYIFKTDFLETYDHYRKLEKYQDYNLFNQ